MPKFISYSNLQRFMTWIDVALIKLQGDYRSKIEGKQDTVADLDNIREGAALGTTSFQIKGDISSTTDIDNLEPGIYTVNTSNDKFPVTEILYGSLLQFNGTYKTQILAAGKTAAVTLWVRRYLSGTSTWSDWSTFYLLPEDGIPVSDLSSSVQTSLGLADTAVQPTDLAASNTPGLVGVNSSAFIQVSNQKNIVALTKTVAEYDNGLDLAFISKGTLNNVLYDRVIYHKGDTITIPSGMQLMGQKTGTAYIDLQVPVIVAPDVTSATVTGSFRAARYGGYIMHKANTATATIATTSLSSTAVSLQDDGRNGLRLRFTAASNWYVQNSTGTVANGSIICGRSYGLTITLS